MLSQLQALVDKKKIVISEAVIREILQLNDAEGMNQVRDLSTHTTCFISPALTQKVFANMRRVGKGFSGVETPLFEGMIAERQPAEEELGAEQVEVDAAVAAAIVEDVAEDVLDTCSALARRVEGLENDKAAQQLDIGRMIADMDMNEGIELVKDAEVAEYEGRNVADHTEKHAEMYNIDIDHSSKVLSIQEDDTEVQEAVEIVTTAKLMTEVVTAATQVVAASTPIPAVKPKILNIAAALAVSTRRRKGVVIRDPEEELSFDTPAETPKVKDKGKGILIEALKPMKKKDQIEWMQIKRGEEDEEIVKSINETPARKAAKRRKLHEQAKEDEDRKKQLEVVDDEDDNVFIEDTPIGKKVPVVDYEIVMINNKPRYKIIKADGTHHLYINFITLLKNFDREDLEDL
nr:hypothetical protein [Tanacetum cinerariifolium]